MKRMLSDREEQLLLLLKKNDFMTRDQLNKYFMFGTISHTNRVLRGLSDYLMTIREGYQTIYYLSKKGKEYVDCEKVRKKGGHVRHVLMRNDMWLFHYCPRAWKNEVEVDDTYTKIVVDAMFTGEWDRVHFLEVDNTQTMAENRNKIKRYKELYQNGIIEQSEECKGKFPKVVFYTTTEYRKNQLKEECRKMGLPDYAVYTIDDIK